VKSANETFKRFNTPLYVCGELAAEQMGAVILVGLGYEALSIDETCVARIKRILSEMTRAEAETVANKALSMTTEQEVLEYVRDVFGEYRKKTEKL
jgi:phosphotransferase system enzyme I (PtsP)